MSARQRLANRRPCSTSEIEHYGLHFKVTVGRFSDGRPSEVFISNHKAGNASDVAARDAGILVSLCLQHGCDSRDHRPRDVPQQRRLGVRCHRCGARSHHRRGG